MFSFLSKKENKEDVDNDLGIVDVDNMLEPKSNLNGGGDEHGEVNSSSSKVEEGEVFPRKKRKKICAKSSKRRKKKKRFPSFDSDGEPINYVTEPAPSVPRIEEYGPAPYCSTYDWGMDDQEIQALCIDPGSFSTRAGFVGDDAPRIIIPTLVGIKKKRSGMMDDKTHFCGEEAQSRRGLMKIIRPVQFGFVEDWDCFEKLLHQTLYDELRVNPEEHPLLMTETPLNRNVDRARMTKLVFETFNVPNFYLISRAVSAIFASGRSTGISVGMGHDVTTCVPMFDSHSFPHATLRMNIGGKDITDYLIKILHERGYDLTDSANREIVRDVKEKINYVALDFESELTKAETISHFCEYEYELPDGSKMTIGSERFRSPEILYKPSFIGSEIYPIFECVYDSIQRCDLDIRKDMFQNIVLWGGSSMFEGTVERMSDEIQKSAPRHARIKVNAPAERKFSSWVGGSILGSLSSYRSSWIYKEEYDDVGDGIVHRKCFH